MQFSSPAYPAVCTLASISLPACVGDDGSFDFDRLERLVHAVVVNTDRCVDISDYPTDEIATSARRTRALGIGVQGLADAFMQLNLSFTSMGARELNISIFETIYYSALDASCCLAEIHGPYPAWPGSPASRGILQVDMWGVTPSGRHDFAALRARIARFGLRNSVLTALMPTASTSKLLGNFESFEPYTRYWFPLRVHRFVAHSFCSNAIVMRTGSGDYPLICPHLVRALSSRGLWTDTVRAYLQRSRGMYGLRFRDLIQPNHLICRLAATVSRRSW